MFAEILSLLIGRDTKDTSEIPSSWQGDIWSNATWNPKGVTGNAIQYHSRSTSL